MLPQVAGGGQLAHCGRPQCVGCQLRVAKPRHQHAEIRVGPPAGQGLGQSAQLARQNVGEHPAPLAAQMMNFPALHADIGPHRLAQRGRGLCRADVQAVDAAVAAALDALLGPLHPAARVPEAFKGQICSCIGAHCSKNPLSGRFKLNLPRILTEYTLKNSPIYCNATANRV